MMKRVSTIHVNSNGVRLHIHLRISTDDAPLTRGEIDSILSELEDHISRIILSKTIPFLRVGIRNIQVC